MPGTEISGTIPDGHVLKVVNNDSAGIAIEAHAGSSTFHGGPAIYAVSHGAGTAIKGLALGGMIGAGGVYGYSDVNYAVHGETEGYTGYGDKIGVFGESISYVGSNGIGVAGLGSHFGGEFKGPYRGVIGISTSTETGTGVYGEAQATSGTAYGLYGESNSSEGIGVYGEGRDGVWGETSDAGGWGVYGNTTSTSGGTRGVHGRSVSTSGHGVYGYAYATSGTNYGVFGRTNSPSGFGGYFSGDVHVTGNLSKGGGSFVIDHPLDPENKLLRHNFVESPDHLLIYQGKAMLDSRGEAIVELPVYFQALTVETEATIQLTPVGRPFLSGVEWNPGFQSFTVFGDGGRQVFWEVLAKRDDPVIHQLARPVEEEKGPDNKLCNKGQLLYPTAYGFPESFGRDFRPQTRPEANR